MHVFVALCNGPIYVCVYVNVFVKKVELSLYTWKGQASTATVTTLQISEQFLVKYSQSSFQDTVL